MAKTKLKNDAPKRPHRFSVVWRFLKSTVSFGWRATLGMVVWVWRQTARATKWAILAPWRLAKQLWRWLNGAPIHTGDPRLDALTAIIRRHYRRRHYFVTHLFTFAIVNIAIWLDYYADSVWYSGEIFSNRLTFTFIWSCLLVFHFVRLRLGEAEDRALQAVLEDNRVSRDKPKRHIAYEENETYIPYPRLALSDDAELDNEDDIATRVAKNR